MAELFTSFDDAWKEFLTREEPLESFFDQFPDEDNEGEGWLIVPPPEIKREVLRLQAELEDVPGLELNPHHFLHVWLRGEHGPHVVDVAAAGPFELAYRNVNCFPTAVVVEAHADRLDRVDAPDWFLPHMTIAVVLGRPDPRPVRDAVASLHTADLGTTLVDELVHVRFPMSRGTVLQPWTVVERMPLRG